MGLVDLASGKSLWRGMDYYNDKKVLTLKHVDKNRYESEVQSSGGMPYKVFIDMDHPRKSVCNCPFADGKRVICKHMVATYFTVCPDEVKRIIDEMEEYEREEEYRQQEERKEIVRYVNSLTKQELREQLVSYMLNERERRYW